MSSTKTTFLYTNFDTTGNPRQTSQLSSSSSSSSPPNPTNAAATISSTSTPPIPNPILRRVHTKSRRGCLNCKRRRIKCPENHPTCTQCSKRGLSCSWPDIAIQMQSGRSDAQMGNVNTNGTGLLDVARYGGYNGGPEAFGIGEAKPNPHFTMLDFRLFNHFIREAHPFHPMMNEEKWTHEVPAISHNYDFLLHAMLGLAASELASAAESQPPTPSTSSSPSISAYQTHALTHAHPSESTHLRHLALQHRLLSIRSLQAILTQPSLFTPSSGNAMLATCYILVFQSALISDGFPDFMSFIRGTMVVAYQMGVKGYRFIFNNMVPDQQLEVLGPHLERPPACDEALLKEAVDSLFRMEHLTLPSTGGISAETTAQNLGGDWGSDTLPGSQESWEHQFWATLLSIVLSARESSKDAYLGIMKIYGLFAYHLTPSQFASLINPDNIVGYLLQAHLVAIQTILDPVLDGERAVTRLDQRNGGKGWAGNGVAKSFHSPRHKGSWEWLEGIHGRVRRRGDWKDWERYFEWTMRRQEELGELVRLEIGLEKLSMKDKFSSSGGGSGISETGNASGDGELEFLMEIG